MADRTITFRRLKQILGKFGVGWDPKKGKGSHGSFCRYMDSGWASYPVPHDKDVLLQYVRGCRKKFNLTEEHGVTDDDFYNA
jgi:hypothetical protein